MSQSLSSFHCNKWTKTSRPKRPTSIKCPRPRPLAQPGSARTSPAKAVKVSAKETDGNTSPSPGKASGKPKTAPAPAPPGKGRRGGAGGAHWIKLLALDLMCLVAATSVPRWTGQQMRSIQAGGQPGAGCSRDQKQQFRFQVCMCQDIPRWTESVRMLYWDILRYTQLYRAIPSYTHPGIYRVILSITRYTSILWPKVYTVLYSV